VTAAAELERRLAESGTPERAEQEKAYLKSDLQHLGVPVPIVRRLVREVLGPLERADVAAVAEQLWARPVHDCRMAAVELLVLRASWLGADDVPLLERMLREARTWALVDPLAIHAVGPLVERDAEVARVLDRWVGDDDVWVRRSALLALLVPLRRGAGDPDRFLRYADALLDDPSSGSARRSGGCCATPPAVVPSSSSTGCCPGRPRSRAHRAGGGQAAVARAARRRPRRPPRLTQRGRAPRCGTRPRERSAERQARPISDRKSAATSLGSSPSTSTRALSSVSLSSVSASDTWPSRSSNFSAFSS
jgi:3-methyladenine DNA glycosylase AlkD